MVYFFLMSKTKRYVYGVWLNSGFLVKSFPDMKHEGLHHRKEQLCKSVGIKLDTELLRYQCNVIGREERADLILG